MCDEICSICLETLSVDDNNVRTAYILPECNHKFHTECIVHWFRAGNCKCPYCCNTGEAQGARFNDCYYVSVISMFEDIKKQSKRENTPLDMKKKVNKVKKIEDSNIELRAGLKSLANSEGLFKDINKQRVKIQRHLCSNKRRIFGLKKELSIIYPVKPLIIVTRKTL
jgi:hypothetical protein